MRYVNSPEPILERNKGGINEGRHKKKRRKQREVLLKKKILQRLFLFESKLKTPRSAIMHLPVIVTAATTRW
jgi:hypothetical protein